MNDPPKVTVNIDQKALSLLYKEKEAQDFIEDRCEAIARQARSTVHVISGTLRDHIEVRENPQGGRDIGVWDVPYADEEEERHPYLRPAMDAGRGDSK